MSNATDSASNNDDNVSERLSLTDVEIIALGTAIIDLLLIIPETWCEVDFDKLTKVQSNALFLLTAAGMVERRGWMRTTMANHATYFDLQFQATGEGGFGKVLQQATLREFQTWGDAWRNWVAGETKNYSPFLVQMQKPQEWRLTDQGVIARENVKPTASSHDRDDVIDYVLKRRNYGPGYWLLCMLTGKPLSEEDQQIVDRHLAAGHDLRRVSRPAVFGSGELVDIRQGEKTSASQPVNLTNWGEGASAFPEAFAKQLGPMFEVLQKQLPANDAASQAKDSSPVVPVSAPNEHGPPPAPAVFTTGLMIFHRDRVTLCGVDICSGARSRSKRVVLELLGKKQRDGMFHSYSGEELEAKAKEHKAKGTSAQWIRDLRADIVKALRSNSNIVCGHKDIILSGDIGYPMTRRRSSRL